MKTSKSESEYRLVFLFFCSVPLLIDCKVCDSIQVADGTMTSGCNDIVGDVTTEVMTQADIDDSSAFDSSWIATLHEKLGHTPIAEAITLWHTAVMANADLGQLWLQGLRQAAEKWSGVCKVGTMFSGGDVIMQILSLLSMFWNHTYNIQLHFHQEFAAERHPKKQVFF